MKNAELVFAREGAAENMGDKKGAGDIDREWKNRVLCSDESCIGTIGADGCCRECGRAFDGVLPTDFHDAPVDSERPPITEAEADTEDPPDSVDVTPEDGGRDADPNDAWERRTLCIDESCIGVVDDSTGRCKECGKPYPKA